MFGNFFGGYPAPLGRFEATYRCFPVSFIGKADAERGDKIFLPPSALDRLAQLHVEYPMLFRLENRREGRSTHSGVLEFIADEGMVFMPYWMMQNLLLGEGDVLHVSSAALPKGSFVKLRPHTSDFLDITNPRAVLETSLRNFSCLSVGDTIPILYNNKRYFIDIVEAQPADAISVIETDCNVDFAPPLDYREPAPSAASAGRPASSASGAGPGAVGQAVAASASEADPAAFLAFAGSGRRLDGRAMGESRPQVVAPARGGAGSTSSASQAPTPPATAPAGKKAGKLMFKDRLAAKFSAPGASEAAVRAETQPAALPPESRKEDSPGFKTFSGKSYRLS